MIGRQDSPVCGQIAKITGPDLCFSLEDAERAFDQWGANCGPGALAAITGRTLDEVRPFLGDFEKKRYTNPTLMFQSLDRLGVKWHKAPTESWPNYGLVRIQWEGPWTKPGVPMRVRYRHTHWIGVRQRPGLTAAVFDINAMCVGGWIDEDEWCESLVPWLLNEVEPKADGRWHRTHVLKVDLK